MRSLIFTAILLVILGVVFAVYLNYDQKRFENNLPKAPRPVASQPEKDSLPTVPENIESSHETRGIDTGSPLVVETEDGALRREETEDAETFLVHPEEAIRHEELPDETYTEVPPIPLVLQKPRGVSLADWLRSLSRKDLEAVYREKPWLKPVDEMTFSEREAEVERRKQRLINTYGNTPEVAIINKYTTMESLIGTLRIQPEDVLEYIRARQVLWPSNANVAAYENLKSLKEKGWHVD